MQTYHFRFSGIHVLGCFVPYFEHDFPLHLHQCNYDYDMAEMQHDINQ